MAAAVKRIKRFGIIERAFHLSLMLTFIIQAATGFSRLYITTVWGEKLSSVLGGYETSLTIHKWVGLLMISGFVIHTIHLITKVDWHQPVKSIFGPDSIIPNFQDVKNIKRRLLWSVGIGPAPEFDRWTYFEKFDYFAVYWGLPLLAITGLMTMYPLTTSLILPGWSLNIAALLHRAEAILAVTYIFIVHFYVGHLRPSSFPMNEAMFAGSMPIEEAMEERPLWIRRLHAQGEQSKQGGMYVDRPGYGYRLAYFIFGYAVLLTGTYLLVCGVIYSKGANLH